MSAATRRQVLAAVTTDADARPVGETWQTRCLHCRSALAATTGGDLLGSATVEHIVPRSWFDTPAARELCEGFDGPDDPRNLALACARCNHGKGREHDKRGAADVRAREVVESLLARRLERWRTAS